MVSKPVLMSIGLAVSAPLAAAHADPGSFVGKWHWNRTDSSLAPGEPAPKDVLLDISDIAGGRLKWTLTEIDPSGQSHTESFDGQSDGTPAKVVGADDQTTASFRLTADGLSATFSGPEGASDSWSCSLSPDQRKMTCRGTQSDGHGHSENYTDSYDRG
jgi:hypothetical protein